MEEAQKLSQEEATVCLAALVGYQGLIAHQIESYNVFLKTKLQDIILENSEIFHQSKRGASVSSARCTFQRVFVRSPCLRESDGTFRELMPQECRIRGLSYNVSVYVNILQEQTLHGSTSRKVFAEVLLCKLPCMLGCFACNTLSRTQASGPLQECPLDPKGYFICNGQEKVVIAQEKMRTNFVFVKALSSSSFVAEVRSLHASKTRSTSTLQVQLVSRSGSLGESVHVNLPFIDMQVPAFCIYKLLGFSGLQEILAFVAEHCHLDAAARTEDERVLQVLRRALKASHFDAKTRTELMEEIGRVGTKEVTSERRLHYIQHIMDNEFLPHQGLDSAPQTLLKKSVFFSVILVKLAQVFLGSRPADDRDDFSLKRVESTGQLFALLLRQIYRQLLKTMTTHVVKTVDAEKVLTVTDCVNAKRITSGIKYALSTGQWGVMKATSQHGVAQILSRMNASSPLSHLRRINTPINREGKLPKPRQLALSSVGILDCVETPEGQACGLVENLALVAHVRLGSDSSILSELLLRSGSTAPLSSTELPWKVFLNGSVEGRCADGRALASRMRQWRASCMIPSDASVFLDESLLSLHVDFDAGCLMRPMLLLEKLPQLRRLLRTSPPSQLWQDLLLAGTIQFIDKNEEREIRIGATHADFHDSCILGLCSGMIPFLNMNQAPRNIYEAAMAKQSIGSFSLSLYERVDTISHVIHYPQHPLVQTMIHEVVDLQDLPGGNTVVVAVLARSGFNQEDSIIVNKGAIDRGLFRSSIFKCYKDEERGLGADQERFGAVNVSAVGTRQANYGKVDVDGLPSLGTFVDNGDVIISKRMIASQLGTDRKKKMIQVDHSSVLRSSEPMRVRRVFITSNKDGGRLARVCLDAVRIPEIGDKLSSHHGQKGVIGMILPEAEMPFTADGVVPDIIVSPHGLPSRMTVGQLLECLLGKLCCMEAKTGDGTPFSGACIKTIGQELHRYGFHDRGEERLFDSTSGAPLETTVFVGLVHYQRLKHFVRDKVHARSRGPRSLLTRSPLEGRSREGGLRVGEMERDCILAHGASSMLLDRLFHHADAFSYFVCRKCGLIAEATAQEEASPVHPTLFCRGCRLSGPEHIAHVTLPYAFKLLSQELAGLNLAMRVKIQKPPDQSGSDDAASASLAGPSVTGTEA